MLDRIRAVLGAAWRAAVHRDFVAGLLAAQDALDDRSFQRLADRIAAMPGGAALLAGPRLSVAEAGWPRMAPGTLGGEWRAHLERHAFEIRPELPVCRFLGTPQAEAAKARWRETHDLRHVLTGLTPALPDEALLHAFQLGQHFTWFGLLLLVAIPLYAARERNPLLTWWAAPEAFRAGRRARLVVAQPVEAALERPLAEVRAEWGVEDLSHLSVAPPPVAQRRGAALVRATLPFAREQRARTWLELCVTAAIWAAALALALSSVPWGLKAVGSALLALLAVRLFAFVHDAAHGALFRDSPLGRAVCWAIGALVCVSPPVWRAFHDRHHRSAAVALPKDRAGLRGGDLLNRIADPDTLASWPLPWRALYRAVRHPLFIAAGWLTAFVIGAVLAQVARAPRQNAIALVTLAAHMGWLGLLFGLGGLEGLLFAGIAPAVGGAALGTWLFFVQHSFPGVEIQEGRQDFVAAALRGSSFFDMPRALHWLTGNFGYHHVHHLNPRIPFYRLPEAMAALPELQDCLRITWAPRDQLACLRVFTLRTVPQPLGARRVA